MSGPAKTKVIVPLVTEEFRQLFNFPKVELHVHLDGSVRHTTLWDLSKEKGIDINGAKCLEDITKLVVFDHPGDLKKMLTAFDHFLPAIVGDSDAIERIAFEMCEDMAKQGVIYFEARYSPHLLCNTVQNGVARHPVGVYTAKGMLDPAGVIRAVNQGFCRGQKNYGVKAYSILCCICGFGEWNREVLHLAQTMAFEGVVGIDVAGSSQGADEQYETSVHDVFMEAARLGIHRTVHAGESGTANDVIQAVDKLKAERIGHGYRLLHDNDAYERIALKQRIHFEACPYSSVITASVPLNWGKHPIRRWVDDDANFSINTDDPTCFGNSITSEILLAHQEIGLSRKQLWKCMLNAAHACFANDAEKNEIIRRVEAAEPPS